ncbi:Phospholipid-transporting ATPase 2-like protein [Drosera capensis]
MPPGRGSPFLLKLNLPNAKTSALDGETDLKTRGVIECPKPDKDIRRFDANLRLFPPFLDNNVCPLTIKNTLLQSCYLRNTEWACGVAIYTGDFKLLCILVVGYRQVIS